MQPSAKVIADSISPDGSRVTTIEVVIHRFVLAELNTHRAFSRNSASSRAIPITRTLESVKQDPAFPIYWGAEKPGMQSGEELEGMDRHAAETLFREVRSSTIAYIEQYLVSAGDTRLHKSVLNRLLEPFLWHKVIVTSTEWDNFFGLRCHPMAQPEIRVAAEAMQCAYQSSVPKKLAWGEWHAPYANPQNTDTLEVALKTSAARCAWVSTVNHDGEHSWEAIERMYDRLSSAEPIHASPFEHQCTPGDGPGNFRGWLQLRHMLEEGRPPWQVKKPDMVNHPPHYGQHPSGVECIQVTEHMNFNLGNVVKYVWRANHKNGIEDLKKARWYLDREISRLEKEES